MRTLISNPAINFAQDEQLVSQLFELLKREQASLVIADVNVIESLLEDKSALLKDISEAANQRYKALAGMDFTPNEEGMLAWVKQQKNPEILSAWERFQKVINQAKETNRLNGLLINKHFSRNQQMLNHLQGNSSQNGVYGKNGQTKPHPSLRPSLAV